LSLPSLYTTIQNTSGASMYYGFLPPHGKTLAADEEYSIAGDLTTRIAMHKASARIFPSYESNLDAVKFVILKTPAVHLFDSTTQVVKLLMLDNKTLGTVHPDWGHFSEPNNATPY